MSTAVPQTQPPGDGWATWLDPYELYAHSPYQHQKVEIWRVGTDEVKTVEPYKLQPQFNVHGLWWRPVSK